MKFRDIPTEYNQWDLDNCIVGLGNRLYRGKLRSTTWHNNNYGSRQGFRVKFGVAYETANALFDGQFKNINPNTVNYGDRGGKVPARSAVSILRYVAKQKALDKAI